MSHSSPRLGQYFGRGVGKMVRTQRLRKTGEYLRTTVLTAAVAERAQAAYL